MSINDNRYYGRNSRGRRSKSYTESQAMKHGDSPLRTPGSGRAGDSHGRDRPRRFDYSSKKREEFVPIPRMPEVLCGICGLPVGDLTSAFSVDKDGGAPVHFECALKKLEQQEQPGHNERIIYIGQGKFAVAYYENPSDQKRFKILRIIQWEEPQGERSEWRNTLSEYYSQIK